MARDLWEHTTAAGYDGRITEDHRQIVAQLGVARGGEAALAVLLVGAARDGAIQLDRIIPFLTNKSPCAHPHIDEASIEQYTARRCPDCDELVHR